MTLHEAGQGTQHIANELFPLFISPQGGHMFGNRKPSTQPSSYSRSSSHPRVVTCLATGSLAHSQAAIPALHLTPGWSHVWQQGAVWTRIARDRESWRDDSVGQQG